MAENTSKQTVQNKFENANKFKWTYELVEDQLKCLGQYKTTMEFKEKDFNADKEVRGMKVIRHCLAQVIYRVYELMLMRMRWKK